MGVNADKALLQIRMLNRGKGAAVQSLRGQEDKNLYHRLMKTTLENTENLRIIQGEAVEILTENGKVTGVKTAFDSIINCEAVILATGERSLIIAFKVLKNLEKQGKSVDIVNARFVKPLDVAFLQNLQSEHVITIEDNMLIGGFGAMVNHTLSAMDKPIKIKNFAYEDAFIPQGKVADLQCEFGVSCEKIENYLLEVLA
jgi:deoxyxylulose-5-phosphate synthase